MSRRRSSASRPTVADNAHLAEYRQMLIAAEQKSQEAFDKTVLSLSGGALGISFVFLKDVIGADPVSKTLWLLAAWILWACSSLAVLSSFYLSQLALRRAIHQVDAGTIYDEKAGGAFSTATAWLNALGAIAFFAGVCAITAFAGANLSSREKSHVRKEAAQPAAASNPAAAPGTPSGQQGSPNP